MGCLLPLVSIFVPRLVMFFIFLLTNWFSQAYHTIIWPVLGFLFMPYTTLAYMATMLCNNHHVDGSWMVLIIVAVVVDLGSGGHQATSVNK